MTAPVEQIERYEDHDLGVSPSINETPATREESLAWIRYIRRQLERRAGPRAHEGAKS